MSDARWPAVYEITIERELDPGWARSFEGLQLRDGAGETTLTGTLTDESALHGVLDKLHGLGLTILSVRRLPPENGAR